METETQKENNTKLEKALSEVKELTERIEKLEQEKTLTERLRKLEEFMDINVLAVRILDVAIESRGDKTAYVSAGNTVACDVVLNVEWQGRRYKLPAFES